MDIRFLAAGVTAAALVAGGASAGANLLTNGSFETGDFTGWTPGGNEGATFVAASGFHSLSAQDGNYFAALGPVGSDGTLSQSFSDTVGQTYVASFWIASDGDTPNDFGVTGPGGLSLPTITNLAQSGYVNYYGTFVGSGYDTITFNFRDDPGYLALDNVSVTSVPEPTAWASMILGLGLAGAALRRRKAVAAV